MYKQPTGGFQDMFDQNSNYFQKQQISAGW